MIFAELGRKWEVVYLHAITMQITVEKALTNSTGMYGSGPHLPIQDVGKKIKC